MIPNHPSLRILSSCYGRINHILIVDGVQNTTPQHVVSRQSKLIEALSKRKDTLPPTFIVITSNDYDDEGSPMSQVQLTELILSNLPNRPKIKIVNPDIDGITLIQEFFGNLGIRVPYPLDPYQLHPWIQDPFLTLRTSIGQTVMLKPYHNWPKPSENVIYSQNKIMNKVMPDILSAQLDIMVKSTPCYFQGGNVLVGDNYALIGKNILIENLQGSDRWDKNAENVLKQLQKDFGVSHVICPDLAEGTSGMSLDPQPNMLFHLDLFVTLAGKNQDGDSIIVVGELHEWDGVSWLPATSASSQPYASYLEDYVRALKRLKIAGINFEVLRLPLAFHQNVIYSYNNCIVEIYSHGATEVKRIYSPVFGEKPSGNESRVSFRVLERQIEAFWNKLLFEMIPIDWDFNDRAPVGAGLHCITHVLTRDLC